MNLTIIDETSGNPFRYFEDDCNSVETFPRSYKKPETFQTIWSGLFTLLGLEGRAASCLEVGAGHSLLSSQALSSAGAMVTVLDADRERRHTFITSEKYFEFGAKLGKDIAIPRLAGRDEKTEYYLGDVAFLRDEKSALKEHAFDLIYFWGSLHSEGICSSVTQSRTPREAGIHIPFRERIQQVIPAVREGGALLAVSGYFSGHFEETPKDISYLNRRLLDLALYWAVSTPRKATSVGVIGYTKEAIVQRFQDSPSPDHVNDRRKRYSCNEMEEHILSDPLEQIIHDNDYSHFGKDEDYKALRAAVEHLLPDQELRKLNTLGCIDAVLVRY